MDVFGNWHCTECEPPAVLAMARREYLIPLAGVEPEPEVVVDGQRWTCVEDHAGRLGWECDGLPGWCRWWARMAFEDLAEPKSGAKV